MWMAFELSSHPDPASSDNGTLVTARVSPAADVDGATVTCQLEFDGAIIAKGSAALQQSARDGSTGTRVNGTMRFAVKAR